MTFKLTIPYQYESINRAIGDGREGISSLKKKWQSFMVEAIEEAIGKKEFPPKFEKKIGVGLNIYYKTKRTRDSDNAFILAKAVIDALVLQGVVPDDNVEWVDFNGIRFFHDHERPRVEVEIATEEKNLKHKYQPNPHDISLAVQSIDNIEYLIEGGEVDIRKVKLACMLAYPSAFRPTMKEMAKSLGVTTVTLWTWRQEDSFQELTLKMMRGLNVYEIPDVAEALKSRALTGDPAASREFINFATADIQKKQESNVFLIDLTANEVTEILTNLQQKNVKKPRITERSSVID